MAIALRYAARSDVGLVRTNNQDSAYAGPHLLVVADGMGGHAGGDIASSLAIGELACLDGESHGSDDALAHLEQGLRSAHQQLLVRVDEEPRLSGMGTTVTALLRTGSRFALAHIGDSRAYLLRDGVLTQITRDHTFVQSLVDAGRLTTEEAERHPQRSVLMRVLSDVVDDAEPDLSMREARIGDRYLLCSDGLSGVVSHDTLCDTLAAGLDPAAACAALVQLALRSGAPDNVTCIVADVVDLPDAGDDAPQVVGAVARSTPGPTRPISTGSPAERAAALTPPPVVDEPVEPAEEDGVPGRRRLGPTGRWTIVAVVVALVAAAAYGAWRWTQTQYFVAADGTSVAIYRGLSEDLGPLRLSRVSQVATDVPVAELPTYARSRVEQGISANDQADARAIVSTLREQVYECRAVSASPSPSPTSPSPTSPGPTSPIPTASPTGKPTLGAGAPASTRATAPTSPTTSPRPTTSATSPSPSTRATGVSGSTSPAPAGTAATAGTRQGHLGLPDPSLEDCGGLG